MPEAVDGTLSPIDHNLGNFDVVDGTGAKILDPYTSWTTNPAIAEMYAAVDGPGGVLLRVPAGPPSPGATWRWESSEDLFFESEVLMWGVRSGDVEVLAR